jgi:pimeloyl-ACP methyl ester carboxylesterase
MNKNNVDLEQAAYTAEYVTSKDGSTVAYRRLGDGPGIILVHGALQASQNLMALAAALSDTFTLYIPDRRGRGKTGPVGEGYGVQKEREDTEAVLKKTGACFIFGLSSGGIIALEAALAFPELQRVGVYEPPFSTLNSTPTTWTGRFDRDVAARNLPAALVTALRGGRTSPLMAAMPQFLLLPLIRYMLERDRKNHPNGDVPIGEIIPTMHYDVQLVKETEDTTPLFGALKAEVLLLGGNKSPTYLRHALDRLEAVLACVERVELRGLDHLGPDNSGEPRQVAAELRRFFGRTDRCDRGEAG